MLILLNSLLFFSLFSTDSEAARSVSIADPRRIRLLPTYGVVRYSVYLNLDLGGSKSRQN